MIELTESEIARFWSKVRHGSGCWTWTSETNNHGYGRFVIYRHGLRIRLLAHRVAYRLTTGVELGHRIARHACDNPPCCNPACLMPGTQADNMRDAAVRGRINTSGLTARRAEQSAVSRSVLARGVRRCSTCREERPIEDFHRNRTKAGGRAHVCRSCGMSEDERRALKRRNEPRALKRRDDPLDPVLAVCTACPETHELTAENTYTNPAGDRWCRQRRNALTAARRARARGVSA